MSTKAADLIKSNEFEELKQQIQNIALTDAQITDLALLLKEKWEKNTG